MFVLNRECSLHLFDAQGDSNQSYNPYSAMRQTSFVIAISLPRQTRPPRLAERAAVRHVALHSLHSADRKRSSYTNLNGTAFAEKITAT